MDSEDPSMDTATIIEDVNAPLLINDIIDFGNSGITQSDFEERYPSDEEFLIKGRLIYREAYEKDDYDVYFGKVITQNLEEYPIVGEFKLTENGGEGVLKSNLKMGDTITFTGKSGAVTFSPTGLKRWNLENCKIQ